jgi:hypothetical protein
LLALYGKCDLPLSEFPGSRIFLHNPLSSSLSNPELLTVIDLLKRYLGIVW